MRASVLVIVIAVAVVGAYVLARGNLVSWTPQENESVVLKEGDYSLEGMRNYFSFSDNEDHMTIQKSGNVYTVARTIGGRTLPAVGVVVDTTFVVSSTEISADGHVFYPALITYFIRGDVLDGTIISATDASWLGREVATWKNAEIPKNNESNEPSLSGLGIDEGVDPYLLQESSETFHGKDDMVNEHVWIAPIAREVLNHMAQGNIVSFNPETGHLLVQGERGLLERGPFKKQAVWTIVVTGRMDKKGVIFSYSKPDDSIENIEVRYNDENSATVLVRPIEKSASY